MEDLGTEHLRRSSNHFGYSQQASAVMKVKVNSCSASWECTVVTSGIGKYWVGVKMKVEDEVTVNVSH